MEDEVSSCDRNSHDHVIRSSVQVSILKASVGKTKLQTFWARH